MPARFTRIDSGSVAHYADVPLALAWLHYAIAWSDEGAEGRLDAQQPVNQRFAVQQAWDALGNAFRAMGLRATAVPAYAAAMQSAYGAGALLHTDLAPDRMLLAPNDGALLRVATGLYGAAGGGAVTPDAWTPVRLRLDDNDATVTACADVPDATCSRAFADRRDYSGAPCPYAPNDYRCGGTDFTGAGARDVLLPLVYSLRIPRDVARQVLADGAGATIANTLAASSDASLPVNTSAPDAAYAASFPEPPGFVRPAPAGIGPAFPPTVFGGDVPPVLGGVPMLPPANPPVGLGSGVTASACAVPPGTLTTREQIVAWNFTHTGCPPLPVPASANDTAAAAAPASSPVGIVLGLLAAGGLAALAWSLAQPPAPPRRASRTPRAR